MKKKLLLSTVAVVFATSCLLSTTVSAQDRGRPGGGGGFFSGGFGGAELLRSDEVRKELELVDEQIEKLEKLGEEMRNEMREMFSGMRDLSQEERQAKFTELRETMRKKGEELSEKVDQVLLPHQRDRLNQIRLQSQLRRSGTSGALTNDRISETLGLSDEQKAKLREVQEKVDRELREKIEKLRDEGRNEILGILTPEQRAKWDEMMGDRFELNSDRGFRGRGGPPQGGRSTDNP